MSPAVKYTLGRLGLFVLIFVLLLPLPLNILVKAMIALVVSAAASYFLLADWRNKMGEQLASAASRRTTEKQRLRAALAGDEEAAAAGDRAARPTNAYTRTGAEADADTSAGAEADTSTGAEADADSKTHRAG